MDICELIYRWLVLPNVLLGERILWRRGLVFVVFSVFTTLLLEPLAHGILANLGCRWNRTAYFALSTVLACSLRLLALQRKAIRAICDELEHHERRYVMSSM